jgi:long-chain acyl-CoA synthetase
VLNLSILLEESARNHAEHTALVPGEPAVGYAEVDAQANRVAGLLTARRRTR